MDADEPTAQGDRAAGSPKKQYEKPELVNLGTVGELTQSGGLRHRDGVATRKLS